MSFVNKQLEAMLLLQFNKISQRSPIAQHGVDAFQNHQMSAAGVSHAGQSLIQNILCIIVAEAHQLRAG